VVVATPMSAAAITLQHDQISDYPDGSHLKLHSMLGTEGIVSMKSEQNSILLVWYATRK
jgi:hypothetical protein